MILAGLTLAGLASRQVRAAEALITHKPVKSFGAGLAGFIGILIAGILAIVRRTSPGVIRARPYMAAIIGVALLDLVSIVPVVGGVASFLGFGAVVLLMWRIFRGTTKTAHAASPTLAPSAG
jgi:hypothetical protein